MAEICPKCGLPKELCVCETIAKEEQRIKIRREKRKFGKITTVIDGLDDKKIDLKDLAKKLKSQFACGGTVKGNKIELQGDHVRKSKGSLIKYGFSKEMIDAQ